MKTILILFAVILSPLAASAAPKIAVQVQLCELPGETKLPRDIRAVLKMKGVDPVAFPKLITPSGKATKASITRDFDLREKGTFQVGHVLSIRPAWRGERIHYSVDLDFTEFMGFAPRSATKAPIFETRKIVGIDGDCRTGEVVWLDLASKDYEQVIQDRGKPAFTRTLRRRLIAILSFTRASTSRGLSRETTTAVAKITIKP